MPPSFVNNIYIKYIQGKYGNYYSITKIIVYKIYLLNFNSKGMWVVIIMEKLINVKKKETDRRNCYPNKEVISIEMKKTILY